LDESRNERKEHYVKPGVKNQMQKLQKNVEAAETKVKYTHSGEIENFGRQLGMLEHQAKAGAGGPKPEELQKVVDAIELIEELLEQQLFNESTYDFSIKLVPITRIDDLVVMVMSLQQTVPLRRRRPNMRRAGR